jgi:hypothetical protein
MMYELFYTAKKEKRVPFEDLGYKMGEWNTLSQNHNEKK